MAKLPLKPSLWRLLAPYAFDVAITAYTVFIIIATASRAWPSATI